jgi:HJR/Mrr/RecB family endonuclease
MLDFTELLPDGIRFEQLVRELCLRSGFEVHWTGVGPDGGRDLILIEKAAGALALLSESG